MPIDPKNQNSDGTWIKGAPSPNPSGRPNTQEFKKLLNKLFPDDQLMFLMFSKLYGININSVDCKNVIKLIDHKDVKARFRKYLNKLKVNGRVRYKDGWNKLNDKEQTDIVFKILDRKYGTPTQSINTEISTPEDKNINVKFIKTKK